MVYLPPPGVDQITVTGGVSVAPLSGDGPLVQLFESASLPWASVRLDWAAALAGAWGSASQLVTNAPGVFTLQAGHGVPELHLDASVDTFRFLAKAWGQMTPQGAGGIANFALALAAANTDGAATLSVAGWTDQTIPPVGAIHAYDLALRTQAFVPSLPFLGVILGNGLGDASGLTGFTYLTVRQLA